MSEKPFVIALKQSKRLLVYLIMVHALMLVTLISLLSHIGLMLISAGLILASFIFYCQRYQWIKSSRAIIKIIRNDKNDWQLQYCDGSVKEKLNLKHCVVIHQLITLHFAGASFWQDTSITMMADAVDDELFRQLSVRLRHIKTFQQ